MNGTKPIPPACMEKRGAAVLHQFAAKHNLPVTHYGWGDDFVPPRLYGIRSDFPDGVAQAYFVQTGADTMLVAWDYFPKADTVPFAAAASA
ncbi:MAG: hypothetical protein HY300_02570 [Verrucomicrobia bacterium]|nr:hypothetical protein [Verrucomicrobiota bacterium]